MSTHMNAGGVWGHALFKGIAGVENRTMEYVSTDRVFA